MVLPIAKKYQPSRPSTGGFVVGKTQTNLPWDSWDRPILSERRQRFGFTTCCMRMVRRIGSESAEIIRELTGKTSAQEFS